MSALRREVTAEQVAEMARCQALLPREAEYVGRKGYRRKYRPDGTYEWRYRFQQNDGSPTNTKRTAEGHQVLERMRPFMRADTERQAKLQKQQQIETMKDRDGQMRLVPAGLTDQAARRNGWSHVWRARGNRVETGAGGMLFRLLRCDGGGWEPLGVHCLGTPLRGGSATVPRRGIQYDPDGNPWRWIAGAWRRTV